jgi:hypothetical protein
MGAEAGRLGVTTMAVSGALVAQQFAWSDFVDWDAGAQQLCAATCFIGRQVSNGASNAPIKTMATAARRNTPLNMVSAYHGHEFLL